MSRTWLCALERASQHAPFLREAIVRNAAVADALAAGDFERALSATRVADGPLRSRLRRERDGLALAVAIADLAGALPLEGITRILSDFADRALDAAIAGAIEGRVPGAASQGFVGLALGKHGSRELNYSSDIDPILLFDPATLPMRARDDAGEAAVRIARDVVDLLQTRDADGYAFRVDLRLRPASEATPLAIPVNAAISHYESSALGWERAAFIRARAASGDIAIGERFLAAITPFVWHRSLDFGAIEALRAMSRRIRSHHASGQRFGPGYDLKRGRGGIREVEFFVQIQQLIHGGRNAALRVPDTLGAIVALEGAGHVAPEDAVTLACAYRLLRTIEHRVQMIEDRQTHMLPADPAALEAVAALHGLGSAAELLARLQPHVDAVGALYDSLDADRAVQLPGGRDALHTTLATAGFRDAASAAARVHEWRGGSLRAVRSGAAIAALETVLPRLIDAFGKAPEPDAALAAFDRMLGRLPSAVNLFRLLDARPALLAQLVAIVSHAPTLADALGRDSALLDRLVDASALDPVGDVATLAADMRREGEELEARLDRVRRVVGEHRFALGIQIVEGVGDPLGVAAGYARVAEAAVATVADAVIADFAAAHGRVPGSELVILALGRLGGAALTHASDLDLIYLFTGSFSAESDGARPLGATHYYNRLSARLSSGLSVPTSAGALYEIDTRLRPSGGDGPLAVSLESFARYQHESAWTWEHMALARARPVYGSAAARAALQSVLDNVLRIRRDPSSLAHDAGKMRADIAASKPPLGPFDVKLVPGGLVDLEFVVHTLQLAHGVGLDPHLGTAIAALEAAGLVAPGLAEAHDFLTRLLVTLRLVSPAMTAPPEATRPIVARACAATDWPDLLARLERSRQCVTDHWQRVAGQGELT